ncbi:MAG: cbb3-type cytochrome oxidase assembly protein CcoS [Burkholderiales bacterium]|nr:cbb3-type cytochrome oxidase assembly protein CcoS [Burkholderiales bacterium]
MDILFLMIPLSLLLVLGIGALLWWAIKTGQFDDLNGPAVDIVMDDDRPTTTVSTGKANHGNASHI